MSYHPNSPIGKAQAERDSDQCFCGNTKLRGQAFCYDCFSNIPEGIRRHLYKRTEDDRYLEALEEAKEELRGNRG